MKLRYSNTIEDVVAFGRYHRAHSRTNRLVKLVVGWVAPALLALLALPQLCVDLSAFLFLLVPSVFMFLLVHLALGPLNDLFLRANYREGDNKGLIGPHEMELSPPNLTERNLVGEMTRWLGAVEKIGTTPTHTFIYLGAFHAHVVPRAAVTDGDYEGFMRALARELEKAKRGGSPPSFLVGESRPAAQSRPDERVSDQPSI